MNRTEIIKARLIQHYENTVGHVAVAAVSEEEWDSNPFGWEFPKRIPGEGFSFTFCAEIIQRATAELSQSDFDNYLMALCFLGDVHITNCDLSPEERTRVAERALYDIAPGSIQLLSRVQLHTLDGS